MSIEIVINSIDPSLQWNPMYAVGCENECELLRARAHANQTQTRIRLMNSPLNSTYPIKIHIWNRWLSITLRHSFSIQLRFMSINLFAPLIKIIIESSFGAQHHHRQQHSRSNSNTDTDIAIQFSHRQRLLLSSLSTASASEVGVSIGRYTPTWWCRKTAQTKMRLVFKFDTPLFDTARYFPCCR